MKNQRIILLFSILLLGSLISIASAENETINESMNETIEEINESLVDESNITDTESPTLLIISPKGLVDSLTPKIEIEVEDENLDSCWYNISQYTNRVTMVFPTRIINCKSIDFGDKALGYEVKYQITVFANDTFGNIASVTVEFETPEIPSPEVNQITIETTNQNNNTVVVNTSDNTTISSDENLLKRFLKK